LRAPSGAVESPKCTQERRLALADWSNWTWLEKRWENETRAVDLSLHHILDGKRLVVRDR
jgi:hypothetical protein